MTNQALRISFEFFPPKTEAGHEKLRQEQNKLAEKKPDFFSVTYGAGGSTRDHTLEVVLNTQKVTGIQTAPHLSCIGDSKEQIAQLLETYQKENIKRIVALRGDLPSGMVGHGELAYARDLVAFIRNQTGDHFHIEVAAYPEVHPESRNANTDILHFKEKVDAGANSAITQYFYNVDAYCDFVDRVIAQNLQCPIIPGIMPITHYEKLARFSNMCGAEIPRWLAKRLQAFGDDLESLQAFGTDVVTELCDELIQCGAPGLHFYTLNQADPSLKVWNNLSLSDYR